MRELQIGDIFWIFMIFVMIYPALQRRMIDAGRVRVMRTLEKKRGSRVIALIHRQEVMSFLGFPLMRYISIEDSEEVLRVSRLSLSGAPHPSLFGPWEQAFV